MEQMKPTKQFKSRYVRWATDDHKGKEVSPVRSDEGNSCRGDCAVCHGVTLIPVQKETSTLTAINQIVEKFELVNKFQLPKLTKTLLKLKLATDRIEKQNEEILKCIGELQKSTVKNCNTEPQSTQNSHGPMQKNLKLNRKPKSPLPEKKVHCRRKRRSYVLHKMLVILNKHIQFRRCRKNRKLR